MDTKLISVLFKNEPEIYSNYKVVFSGRFAEVYQYTIPVVLNRKPKARKPENVNADMIFDKDFDFVNLRAEEYRKRRYTRAFSQISRFIECNFKYGKCAFLTLTFEYNMKSMKVAKNVFFKPFIARMKLFYPDFVYLGVTEFQKRGAVHFHLIINQYIDKDVLLYCWPWGRPEVKKPYSSHGLGIYFSKYLTKNHNDPRYREHKFYFNSHSSKYRKIVKPKIVYAKNAEIIFNFLMKNAVPVYSHVYRIPDFTKSYFKDFEIVNYVRAEKYNIAKFLPLDLRSEIL